LRQVGTDRGAARLLASEDLTRAARLIFVEENGEGPGARLKKLWAAFLTAESQNFGCWGQSVALHTVKGGGTLGFAHTHFPTEDTRMFKKRRTPPIPVQTIPPFSPTNALIQRRLIDFDTGSAELEEQHKTFLSNAIGRAKVNSSFHVRIFGFASHLGNHEANRKLSLARMQSVFNFMRAQDGRVLNSIEMFEAFGDGRSQGGAKDDAPEFRAVEVHIFIGDIPPIDPPNVRPVPRPPQPTLPGGPRSGRWAVATPGGATVTVGPSIIVLTAGVTIGANLFSIKNLLTSEQRVYAVVAFGLGVSLGLPAASTSLKNALQTILTGPNFSNLAFTEVFPHSPVTFAEVEDCLVSITGANAGALVISASIAVITFDSIKGFFRFDTSGQPIRVPGEEVWSFNSAGRNWQLGAGESSVTGPLIRLDN
jgi:outer membrane protein OmpA-like peptidoglycan-associated protein